MPNSFRQALYEEFYCARREMENRIKEQQLALFADRTAAEQPNCGYTFPPSPINRCRGYGGSV
jgi:hypothetical protein